MKIGIIGLGLIGGSLGKAIKKYTAHEVYGYDKDASVCVKALKSFCCDAILDRDAIKTLDILAIALNEGVTLEALNEYAPLVKNGTLIFDVCGNKRRIVAKMCELKATYPEVDFVGAHPMAGKERGGVDHASADLFKGAYIVAVPVGNSSVEKIKNLFECLGAKGLRVSSAEEHDEMIAYTSQLAHVVSSSYVKDDDALRHIGFSAGSFKDLTRVARLDADMWTELFINNSDKLLAKLDKIIDNLCEYREALKDSDGIRLHALLEDGTRCKEIADNCEKEAR